MSEVPLYGKWSGACMVSGFRWREQSSHSPLILPQWRFPFALNFVDFVFLWVSNNFQKGRRGGVEARASALWEWGRVKLPNILSLHK